MGQIPKVQQPSQGNPCQALPCDAGLGPGAYCLSTALVSASILCLNLRNPSYSHCSSIENSLLCLPVSQLHCHSQKTTQMTPLPGMLPNSSLFSVFLYYSFQQNDSAVVADTKQTKNQALDLLNSNWLWVGLQNSFYATQGIK